MMDSLTSQGGLNGEINGFNAFIRGRTFNKVFFPLKIDNNFRLALLKTIKRRRFLKNREFLRRK